MPFCNGVLEGRINRKLDFPYRPWHKSAKITSSLFWTATAHTHKAITPQRHFLMCTFDEGKQTLTLKKKYDQRQQNLLRLMCLHCDIIWIPLHPNACGSCALMEKKRVFVGIQHKNIIHIYLIMIIHGQKCSRKPWKTGR